MIEVSRYESSMKSEWDEFVRASKNGVFLFERDYMDYHNDRFVDNSLMVRDDETLIAVLPANLRGSALQSHGGLTYGGFIWGGKAKVATMLEILDELAAYCKQTGINTVVYKALPHIYHQVPCEEDLYALFRVGAKLVRRDASTTIRMDSRPKYSKGRKYSLSLARKAEVLVSQSFDFVDFMNLEAKVLSSRHGKSPVHSASEIELLASRFPENIQLFIATNDYGLLAGVLLYRSKFVLHTQYMGAIPEGQEVGALDAIVDHILSMEHSCRYFDFGISTEDNGKYLNKGLARQKEMFGGSTVLYDTYEINFD